MRILFCSCFVHNWLELHNGWESRVRKYISVSKPQCENIGEERGQIVISDLSHFWYAVYHIVLLSWNFRTIYKPFLRATARRGASWFGIRGRQRSALLLWNQTRCPTTLYSLCSWVLRLDSCLLDMVAYCFNRLSIFLPWTAWSGRWRAGGVTNPVVRNEAYFLASGIILQ